PALPKAPGAAPRPPPSPEPAETALDLDVAPARSVVDRFAGLEPLDRILAEARDKSASDVHLVAGRSPLFRVTGELAPSGAPIEASRLAELLLPAIPERLRGAFEKEGSCDFARAHATLGRFRANVTRQRTGLKGSF